MKTIKLSLFALAQIILLSAAAQAPSRYRVSVDVFAPVTDRDLVTHDVPGLMWGPENWYINKTTSVGYAASLARSWKHIWLGYRVGWVNRRMDETNYLDLSAPGTPAFVEQRFKYRERHIWNSIFLKHEEHFRHLSLNLGIELPFIYYGKAVLDEELKQQTFTADTSLQYESTGGSSTEQSSGYASGIGIQLGLAYRITLAAGKRARSMSIGVDACNYLLYTRFKGTNRRSVDYHERWIDPASTRNTTMTVETPVNISRIGFSNISPRFYLLFDF